MVSWSPKGATPMSLSHHSSPEDFQAMAFDCAVVLKYRERTTRGDYGRRTAFLLGGVLQ